MVWLTCRYRNKNYTKQYHGCQQKFFKKGANPKKDPFYEKRPPMQKKGPITFIRKKRPHNFFWFSRKERERIFAPPPVRTYINIWLFSCLSGRCSDAEIITREEWEARPPTGTTPLGRVGMVFIHHTLTDVCNSQSTCSATMRSMQNYHMDSNGKRIE